MPLRVSGVAFYFESNVMYFFREFWVSLQLLFKGGLRGLPLGFSLVLIVAVLMSAFFSGRQSGTVALDVGFSVVRLLVPVLIVFYAQELLTREFDKRYFLTAMSYPRGRVVLLLGRFSAIILLSILFLLFLMIILFFLVGFVGYIRPQSTSVSLGVEYLVSIFFMMVELFVVAAVASLFAVFAVTPSFVLVGTLGFLFIARSFGSIVSLLGRDSGLVVYSESYQGGLGVLSYLLPDLGALDMRMLSLYGRVEFLPSNWWLPVAICFFYAASALALSVWVLHRKRIS